MKTIAKVLLQSCRSKQLLVRSQAMDGRSGLDGPDALLLASTFNEAAFTDERKN
jgi:hypothetical protein